MRDEGLAITYMRKRRYSSYKGEISPEVPNLLARDFHADRPGKKLLTDITEFSIPSGKVYLSPHLMITPSLKKRSSQDLHPALLIRQWD